MSLTVHLCLAVTSALLLLLCSTRSCLGTTYEECLSDPSKHCGDVEFSYPFGKTGSGCGDPDFQFDCAPNNQGTRHPVLDIGTYKYRILTYGPLGEYGSHILTIANDIWFQDDFCKALLANYNKKLWPDSEIFQMTDGYTTMTFWKDCDETFLKIPGVQNLHSCQDDWHYSVDSDVESQGAGYCNTSFLLPIHNRSPQSNIDSNLLRKGFEITWYYDRREHVSCSACLDNNGICGYNSSEPETFLCYCPRGISYTGGKCRDNGGSKKAIIIGCSIGGSALIAIVIAALFLSFYAKRRKTLSRGLASGDMEAAMLPRREIGNLPIFSYEELQQATNCFHEENELGDGGFGSVYLGKLRDGRTVAVKRLYQDNSRRLEQFINEVKVFSTLNHPHVVRLYGCTSADSPELLLVYEFVPNGTLDDHLHGDRKNPNGLPWNVRLKIAIQTAEALAFLHSIDPPIFHRDVKSSNILLDENFNVKVADFGLCRIVPVNASHVTTAPQGTPGYVDPEYHQCYQLTEKSDVYSFGVVLVEIISAKLAVDINRNRNEIGLANMAKSKIQEGALHELVDPQLEIEANHELKVTVSAVADLAFRCLASERDGRPHMSEVAAQLREIKQSWDTSTDPGEQQWGSFSKSKQPLSPISVQDNWSRHVVEDLSSKQNMVDRTH